MMAGALPRRRPWVIGYGLVIVALVLAALGVISFAAQTFVNVAVAGYFAGRWHEVRERSELARVVATEAAEGFIADAHVALTEGEVPLEDVDELEAQVREAQFALGVLDTFAPRRLRLWPPGLVRSR